jgi:3-methyladenine DNA glycosylase AlkD
MLPYNKKLIDSHASCRNEADAPFMKKYMKGKFEYFGIKSPKRREMLAAFLKENGLPAYEEVESVVWELWQQPERELQYTAMELYYKFRKNWNEDSIFFLEKLILDKSWWDTVDALAVNYCGYYFKNFPFMIIPVTEKWMNSDNMWLQRSAILFQLKYKTQTNTGILFNYISRCSDSKEFFIQKSIGWDLRELSKTNPEGVADFIRQQPLKPLSVREGSKYLVPNFRFQVSG